MSTRQRPVPGRYYINLTGRLVKVRALLFVEGGLSRILVEYLDGRLRQVPVGQWDWLDLSCYNDWVDAHKGCSEVEREV